jgi:hypothetical protein
MSLLTSTSSVALWQDTIRDAQDACAVTLQSELEAYLVYLLIHYTRKPDMAKRAMAIKFLETLQLQKQQRSILLQEVGDQCLLLTGLFPQIVVKRHVKIRYFVDLGQAAYATISKKASDLYSLLAIHFISLMDVLQSIRLDHSLLPLEAYEQWNELGSRRAFKILQEYTLAVPVSTTVCASSNFIQISKAGYRSVSKPKT